MNNRVYPFDLSLKNVLRSVITPSLGVRLMDTLMSTFGTTQTETEVLIHVASFRKPVSFDALCEELTYLTSDTIKRALVVLADRKLIFANAIVDHEAFEYTAAELPKITMKSFTQVSLESVSPATYAEGLVKVPEPVAVPEPVVARVVVDTNVVSKDLVFDLLEALKNPVPQIAGAFARGTGGIDWDYIVEVVRGTILPTLEVTEPIPAPAPTPRLGFFETMVKAARDWFASK